MKLTKKPKYNDRFLKIPEMCTLRNILESNLRRSKLPTVGQVVTTTNGSKKLAERKYK